MKKIILLLSLILTQSAHAALQLVTQYRYAITCTTLFCASELVLNKLPQISSLEANEAFSFLTNISKSAQRRFGKQGISPIISYLPLALPRIHTLLPYISLFCSHEAILKSHINYSQLTNMIHAWSLTANFFQYKTFQDRLTFLSLFSIPTMYCDMERNPFFFNDSHLSWVYRFFIKIICNMLLKNQSSCSVALSAVQFIDSSIFFPIYKRNLIKEALIKLLKAHETEKNDPDLKDKDDKFWEQQINILFQKSNEQNAKLVQLQEAIYISYTFSKASGILKTPFPNAYNFLPSKVTHYANQPIIKAKASVLFINILQNMAYVCFIRLVLYNAIRTIHDYGVRPLVDLCTSNNTESKKNTHKIDLKHYLCFFSSGIIMFFCCDKILHLLYQKKII